MFLSNIFLNILRNISWNYAKLPEEHPSIYKEFIEGEFVLKTCTGFLNAVTPDMKRFKKDAGGIINQTKHKVFLTE